MSHLQNGHRQWLVKRVQHTCESGSLLKSDKCKYFHIWQHNDGRAHYFSLLSGPEISLSSALLPMQCGNGPIAPHDKYCSSRELFLQTLARLYCPPLPATAAKSLFCGFLTPTLRWF